MEKATNCRDSITDEDVEPFPDIDEVGENYAARESPVVDEIYTDMNEGEENFAARECTAIEDSNLEPYLGMVFDFEHTTYSFYNEYAKRVGFGIRKRFIRRSRTNNEVIGRTYVCSREGIKQTRKVDNPRPNTRLDCKAMMKVKRYGNGKWVLIKFIKEHNHELYPLSACIFQSQLITTYTPSSEEVSKMSSTATKQSNRVKSLHGMDNDGLGFLDEEQRESLSAGDAKTIYEYFMLTQVSNPRFFYAMELDERQQLRNVFWADTKSRVTYSHFGDVITFDTAYLTKKYEMKLVLFVGVNHHGQSMLLGCALVTDETKASFLWVFRTWLTVMQGGPPKAIITDQHEAIKAAILEVFPETHHRLCLWHIMKKVPEKLGSVFKANEGLMYKFEKCIYDSLTSEQFERRWKKLIEAYELKDHEWLHALYDDRRKWVPVYLKDTFFGGMSTSKKSESLNSFFDDYICKKTCLKEFIGQYELALQRSYNDEERADLETSRKTPNLITKSPYEAQMASVYTIDIFKKFQDEILQIPSCNAVHIQQDEGSNATYVVKELVMKLNGKRAIKDYTVIWNGSETTVSCICRLFEFEGYICRHAMLVLFAVGEYEIPSHYVLKRWTMDVKNLDIFNGAQDIGPEFISKCYEDLREDSIKLAEEGSLSKERYRAAKIFLKEALIKVKSMDKVSASVVPITKPKEVRQITWSQN